MDLKGIKDLFRLRTEKVDDLSGLPLSFAKIVRIEIKELSAEQKKNVIVVIKNWINYVKGNNLQSMADPFTVRFHLNEFAKREFGQPKEPVQFETIELENLKSDGKSFREIISEVTNGDILDNKEVSIYGGTARLALKIFAGVDVSSELPINDIDLITNSKNPEEIAKKYEVDLAGTKIIDGDLLEATKDLADNVDCTMNQVAIIDGKLFYTKQALEDVQNGVIRLLGKNDPLFGSEGIQLSDGNIYLTRSGFYRTLSFLLRGKGEKVLVSKENLEREKDNIGRYWIVMLFVKLLKMQDKEKLDEAVVNWYLIAKQIGSTNTNSPFEFLNELLIKFPEMANYGKEDRFDANAQVRWLIGKLTSIGKCLL
jgi:hypothetical protein